MAREKRTILSTSDLKNIIDETEYYTFFQDRLYVYNKENRMINGYMLKEDFDSKKVFKEEDKEAASLFAQIEMQFKNEKEEAFFDYDAFVDTVLSDLEVWLSYSSELEDLETL